MTKPSKKNYKAIVDKVRSIIKSNATCRQEDLIRQLNPVIRGGVNYQKYNVRHYLLHADCHRKIHYSIEKDELALLEQQGL